MIYIRFAKLKSLSNGMETFRPGSNNILIILVKLSPKVNSFTGKSHNILNTVLHRNFSDYILLSLVKHHRSDNDTIIHNLTQVGAYDQLKRTCITFKGIITNLFLNNHCYYT